MRKNQYMDFSEFVDPKLLEKAYLKTTIKRSSSEILLYIFEKVIEEMNERKENGTWNEE